MNQSGWTMNNNVLFMVYPPINLTAESNTRYNHPRQYAQFYVTRKIRELYFKYSACEELEPTA